MFYRWIVLPSNVINETAPKVHCFAGFLSPLFGDHKYAYTHTYCFPLFVRGMKTGLWTIALCRKYIANTVTWTQRTTVKLIVLKIMIDILQAMASWIIAYGDPINGTGFDNWFSTKYWLSDYFIILLLCGNKNICHRIVLRYLLAVLRLLCAL